MGSSPGQIKEKTIKLVLTGFTLNMQHKGVRTKTGWLRFSVSEWGDKSTRRLV